MAPNCCRRLIKLYILSYLICARIRVVFLSLVLLDRLAMKNIYVISRILLGLAVSLNAPYVVPWLWRNSWKYAPLEICSLVHNTQKPRKIPVKTTKIAYYEGFSIEQNPVKNSAKQFYTYIIGYTM